MSFWLTNICTRQVKPTHVLNSACLTGRPNVDWCEDHKVERSELGEQLEPLIAHSLWQWLAAQAADRRRSATAFDRPFVFAAVPIASLCLTLQIETIRVNVLGMLNLADICHTKGIHLTTYATGCIFHYDKDFPENSGKGFKEGDKPNFTGSYYSYTKVKNTPLHCM